MTVELQPEAVQLVQELSSGRFQEIDGIDRALRLRFAQEARVEIGSQHRKERP